MGGFDPPRLLNQVRARLFYISPGVTPKRTFFFTDIQQRGGLCTRSAGFYC